MDFSHENHLCRIHFGRCCWLGCVANPVYGLSEKKFTSNTIESNCKIRIHIDSEIAEAEATWGKNQPKPNLSAMRTASRPT